MSGDMKNDPFLPEDLFGLVLSFLLERIPPHNVPYDREEHGYILSLRLTSKAWCKMIDSTCRVIVPFVWRWSEERFDKRIPPHSTLPAFVLPSFRLLLNEPSSNTDPGATDVVEKMAHFVNVSVPRRALTDRHNLQALELRTCSWDERTILQSSPALETVWIENCRDGIEVSSLPNLRNLFYNNFRHLHLGLLNFHSLDKLETLSVALNVLEERTVCMDRAPEVPRANTIYVEPFKTVKSLRWARVDICSDGRCWEWTRSIERVRLDQVRLTKINGPLQIVDLILDRCRGLQEIDLPNDAPTKRLSISGCTHLRTVKAACRLHSLTIQNCSRIQRLDVKVLRNARINLVRCAELQDVGDLRTDARTIHVERCPLLV